MKESEHSFLEGRTIEKASLIFKALADPTRLRIMYLLSQEECSVNHIAEVLRLSQSAVSHQLSLLRKQKLVKFTRAGNTLYYTYDDEHVIEILNQVITHVEHS
ncbi:transcriptional regulator [Desulfuribacillus stibiiarsenatis]|uniref:Transcriptional regulator n=1 Tax=Desulfuribacillus stibiiarsenatis TaxID=1390249 RepID=A0A1E5L4Q2_9FIRM|nr:metalloregulator ArsR/SmtB family transcription factor [Desulfuribacillus stibiiarsenatis]OEH85091.1 transcriptional regulator [Desulfuribacillus stibiiarsenatis]